ncbi:hypothetical protein [Pseudomonas putida]|nr:hypothetical protein [Pseudomonas putida]HDS0965453.1 hypothetical protein [Pseudomonas putida]HDS0992715.1 hypothetical protein [Pseudomonas putida]
MIHSIGWPGAITASRLDCLVVQSLTSSAQTIMRYSATQAYLRIFAMQMSAVHRTTKIYFAVTLLATVSACVNLEEVQKFSSQSAALTSSNDINSYLKNGKARQEEYEYISQQLSEGVDCGDKAYVKKTCPPVLNTPLMPFGLTPENQKSIESLHKVLSHYMANLATLAGDDLTSVNGSTNDLVKNLNNLPSTAQSDTKEEKEKQNAAYGAVLKLISIPQDIWRQYELKKIIEENDNSINTLTALLSQILEDQSDQIAAEHSSVDRWYSEASAKFPPKSLDSALAITHSKKAELKDIEAKKSAALKYSAALKAIGDTHHKLAIESGSLDSKSGKQIIAYVKAAREQVVAARKQYDDAFKGESEK